MTSTPLKSTSTVTLVQSESSDHSLPGLRDPASSPPSRTPPVDIFSRRSPRGSEAPCTVLTPPEADELDGASVSAKVRIPSGDGGYVDMSPGVSHNLGPLEEQSSLAILEESLGKELITRENYHLTENSNYQEAVTGEALLVTTPRRSSRKDLDLIPSATPPVMTTPRPTGSPGGMRRRP